MAINKTSGLRASVAVEINIHAPTISRSLFVLFLFMISLVGAASIPASPDDLL